MFRGLLSAVLVGSISSWALPLQPPAEVYHNRTTIQDPQVNARHFVNDGDITTFGIHPWDSQNTITFTNRGSMFGAVGFRFETVADPFGIRLPANSFLNTTTGEILAADVFSAGGLATSLIKINANSITNRGLLNVGANGFIQLHGRNVDLTSGKLVVGDIDDPLSGGFGFGAPSLNDTNFFPGPGIFDLAWGIGNYTNTDIGGILISVDPGTVSTPTPSPIVTNDFGGSFPLQIFLDDADLWWRKEVIDETNEVIQLIAVQVSDPSIETAASFTDVTYYDGPNGGFLSAAVELRVGSTDFTTFQRVTNSLYIIDQLGASTNRALMQNLLYGTFRPGNFIVGREAPGLFGGGPPDNTNVPPNLITGRQEITPYATNDVPYLNSIVTNDWSGYVAELQSVAALLPVVPGAVVTNLGGQVEVNAQQLYLRNTRIRGQGFVTLTATNVTIAGSNVVDVPRISLDFGSGPGVLQLNEIVPDSVERFEGDFSAYSTVFTNYYERYTTNIVPVPAPVPAAGLVALSVPPGGQT